MTSKLNVKCRADSEKRQGCEEAETNREERNNCTGPSPKHRGDVAGPRGKGPFGLVSNLYLLEDGDVPSAMSGCSGMPTSPPLQRPSQDNWLSC